MALELFEQQLREGIARGDIRTIDAKHVLLLIIANIQFVFHGKNMNMHLWQLDEGAYEQFCEQHKQVIKEMVLHFLFFSPNARSFFLPVPQSND